MAVAGDEKVDPPLQRLGNLGSSGSKEEFLRSAQELAQWVHWHDRCELVLQGRYHEVKPLHVELCSTYLCNFACPSCSCRKAREGWAGVDAFSSPRATPNTVMSWPKMKAILDELAKHDVGVMWTGGEPTINLSTYEGIQYAHSLGLKQCLFTNGSLLTSERIEEILRSELVFVRFSLNSASEEVHAKVHGYPPEKRYISKVLNSIRTFAHLKLEKGSKTLCGVSIIVGEQNIYDLIQTAEFVRGVINEVGRGAIDYAIFRPVYQFYGIGRSTAEDVREQLLNQISERGAVKQILDDCGVTLVVRTETFVNPQETVSSSYCEDCLSCGWFSEVAPNGEILLCSDRYGDPDFVIGNLARQSLDEIWASERRSEVLKHARSLQCFKNSCPRNGRGFHLNVVFHEIESNRQQGKIDQVRYWVKCLPDITPKPSHSFFL